MTVRTRLPKRNEREDGIVMIVVMLVLLMLTATATFAIHSTNMDIRAAGHSRVAMQAHNLATTSLITMADYTERMGVETVMATIAQSTLNLTGLEPAMAPGRRGARFYSADFGAGAADPAPTGVFGPRQAHVPASAVDVYDAHAYSIPIPGHRADGLSPFKFVRMTFTARARARIAMSPTTYVADLETASDARAHVVAGPSFLP